jgi:CheY-like chemotaxis protein
MRLRSVSSPRWELERELFEVPKPTFGVSAADPAGKLSEQGIEATRLIRKDQPECRVVLVSGSIFVDRGDEGLEAARAAGASAYVVKSKAVLDLAEVVVSGARSTGNMSASKTARSRGRMRCWWRSGASIPCGVSKPAFRPQIPGSRGRELNFDTPHPSLRRLYPLPYVAFTDSSVRFGCLWNLLLCRVLLAMKGVSDA